MQRGRRWPLVVAIVLMAVGLIGAIAGAVVVETTSNTAGSATGAPRRFGGPSGPGAGGSAGSAFGGYASNGERIYYTGVGHAGPIAADWSPPGGFGGGMMGGRGRMGAMGCVRCHGRDGRGGTLRMMGVSIVAPDIRYSSLTTPRREGTETVAPWTEAQIENAIRQGVEPSGETLDRFMPRWDMDATDMKDTIGYLKELSQR